MTKYLVSASIALSFIFIFVVQPQVAHASLNSCKNIFGSKEISSAEFNKPSENYKKSLQENFAQFKASLKDTLHPTSSMTLSILAPVALYSFFLRQNALQASPESMHFFLNNLGAIYGFIGVAIFFGVNYKRGFYITGRPLWNYLLSLKLLNYDFRGKKVLDIGSGKARFSRILNNFYGKDNTFAVDLDITHGIQRGQHAVTADMVKIPFENSSFDLVLSSFSYYYFFPTAERLPILEEIIRVTAPRGVIKLKLMGSQFRKAVDEGFKDYLEDHSRIKTYSYYKMGPEIILEIELYSGSDLH